MRQVVLDETQLDNAIQVLVESPFTDPQRLSEVLLGSMAPTRCPAFLSSQPIDHFGKGVLGKRKPQLAPSVQVNDDIRRRLLPNHDFQ